MTQHRFFVPVDLREGEVLDLPDEAAHHLRHVLRLAEGEQIALFNGEGGAYLCVIQSITKRSVTVLPLAHDETNLQSGINVHIGICVLKRDAMDRAIGRMIELGVRQITPLISEHCTVSNKVIRGRGQHWQQVARSSCEQCGLNVPPPIMAASPLNEWLQTREEKLKLVSSIGASSLQINEVVPSSIALLTGPEGGFTEAEIHDAQSAGFQPVSFGGRILRAETAPLVALSVLQRTWGDYQV